MIKILSLSTALFSMAMVANAQHVHGEGNVNISIDSRGALIELIATADDVVGFEHTAETAAEKAAITKAIDHLSQHDLFTFNTEAGCTADETEAEFEVEDDHAEFHVEHEFTCENTSAIRQVSTSYFDLYNETTELEATVVTNAGSKKYDWEASTTTLAF